MAKTFKGEVGAAATRNPAMQFIDTPEPEREQDRQQPERTGQRMNISFVPQNTERRSKRIQVLLQPSLYERLKADIRECIHKDELVSKVCAF